MDNKTAAEFLDKYREFEENVRNRYGSIVEKYSSPAYFIIEQKEFKNYATKIKVCAWTRNLLSHNAKIKGEYPVIPTRALIGVLDYLNKKLKRPLEVSSIMVDRENVFYAKRDDRVLPVMENMNKKAYTHVPILEDERITGVFSENTLLTLLANNKIVMIDDDYDFRASEIRELLPIDAHSAEKFIFIPSNMTIFELKEIFEKAVSKGERIGLAFVTYSGKENEKLQGIISPWDIAGD